MGIQERPQLWAPDGRSFFTRRLETGPFRVHGAMPPLRHRRACCRGCAARVRIRRRSQCRHERLWASVVGALCAGVSLGLPLFSISGNATAREVDRRKRGIESDPAGSRDRHAGGCGLVAVPTQQRPGWAPSPRSRSPGGPARALRPRAALRNRRFGAAESNSFILSHGLLRKRPIRAPVATCSFTRARPVRLRLPASTFRAPSVPDFAHRGCPLKLELPTRPGSAPNPPFWPPFQNFLAINLR